MKLHENKELFEEAIARTVNLTGIPSIYVEKDYWVTKALYEIFHSPIGTEAVFKGGTALSKCFSIIERFSEDIDLVVLQEEGESGNRLANKLKKITKAVGSILKEVDEEGITNKKGMIRKVAYDYPKVFKGAYGQVRSVIIVEATWLGRFEPYHQQNISSYVYEMMKEANQLGIAEEYNMIPFKVNVLDAKRTVCEKIMSLVRFSYGENTIEDLRNKIRHTYDIHQLLKEERISAFFNSSEFDEMLVLVGQDDVASFKSGNKWLEKHPKDALVFSKTEETWSQLKGTYSNEFKDLVYGEFPDENDVLKTMQLVSSRLQGINWTVKTSK
ncbi:MAG: hypothetical protein ACJA0Q_001356 [Saprospiraceae bacterium]|jgi:hypothetical protein